MKKNYKIISVFFTVSFLILTISSCGIINPEKNGNVSDTKKYIADETSSSFDLTKELNILKENLVTGESTTTTAHEVAKGIAEPEKIGSLIGPIEPGEKIKLAVKIANVAADNGDKIVVHFHFAPTDSSGAYFTDDIVSTHDIFITSSGK